MISKKKYRVKKIWVLQIMCFLFIVFISYNKSNAQGNKVADSLKQLLVTASNDSVTMGLYNQLRRATYYSDPVTSKDYTLKMLEYAIKRKDSFHIALSNYYLGNANITGGNFVEALPYYLKAAEYFERKEDLNRLGSVYNGVAAAYENNGNDSLSLKYFKKSYAISNKIGDNKKMGIALNNISNIYKHRGELDIAIEYLEKAVTYFEDPKLDVYLKTISLNLANIYIDANRYEEAKNIYERVIKNVDTIQDVYNYATALRGLGNVYYAQGDNKKSLYFVKKAFKKYTDHNFNDERYETMKDLVDTYYKNNEYRKAIELYYEFNTIKDSIFNSDKDKNLTEALQKYEAEKKDREIIEQNLIIEKKNKQKNRILYGLIALGIFSILLLIFFRKRLKYKNAIAFQKETLQKQKITELQQKNKLLAMSSMIEGQEAERLRIAKDLHDSLGGLLSTVKAHFTTIQNEVKQLKQFDLTDKTNELIDEACLEVRRISHNMMPHALSIAGLKGAIEDLGEHLNEQGYIANVEIKNLPEKMESTKEIIIYRLIQEVISNIRKHAKAKSILVQLIGHNNEISLIIVDDGKGFNYSEAITGNGLGLKSINSRVQFLDGMIDWDTQPHRGTSLTINIPVS